MKVDIGFTPSFTKRTCVRCKVEKDFTEFIRTKSPFYEGGAISLCNDCIKDYLKQHNFD